MRLSGTGTGYIRQSSLIDHMLLQCISNESFSDLADSNYQAVLHLWPARPSLCMMTSQCTSIQHNVQRLCSGKPRSHFALTADDTVLVPVLPVKMPTTRNSNQDSASCLCSEGLPFACTQGLSDSCTHRRLRRRLRGIQNRWAMLGGVWLS